MNLSKKSRTIINIFVWIVGVLEIIAFTVYASLFSSFFTEGRGGFLSGSANATAFIALTSSILTFSFMVYLFTVLPERKKISKFTLFCLSVPATLVVICFAAGFISIVFGLLLYQPSISILLAVTSGAGIVSLRRDLHLTEPKKIRKTKK